MNLTKKLCKISAAIASAALILSVPSGALANERENGASAPFANPPAESSSAPTATSETPVLSSEEPELSEPEDTSLTDNTDAQSSEEETTPAETTEPPVPAQLVLGQYEFYLEQGGGAQISAWIENADPQVNYPAITFECSDTSVARIDASGYIIAMGVGSAAVTVRSGELYATASVVVREADRFPEFLVLTESEFTLKIDETAEIEAKLLPEDVSEGYEITFESNSPEIASVDENGVITAKEAGEAYITVSGADLSETVYVTVTDEIAYETAQLDGYLYDSSGNPMTGSCLKIDDLSAITDKNGYFSFESVEKRSVVIKLSDDEKASCSLDFGGKTTVYLLYDENELKRLETYEELAGLLMVGEVKFTSSNIVMKVGEVYELSYTYEPKDAGITEIDYESSNPISVQVGKVDGVLTAKSAGEATVTLSLNNGQALAYCYITVNPEESSQYSALIVAIEGAVLVCGAAAAAIVYRKYRSKLKKQIADNNENAEEDLHDIDD